MWNMEGSIEASPPGAQGREALERGIEEISL
jgi:hypothetical protein